MDLSVVIVNYNTRDLTIQTIKSVYAAKHNFLFEIILVDNGSTDDSVEKIRKVFPEIVLIENDKNLGFSKANNIGIKKATGKYILLLNSDTVVEKDTLSLMFDYMDTNLGIGASGCKVVLPSGSLDKACKRSFPTPQNALFNALKLDKLFPNNRAFGSYNLTYLDEDQVHEVDCLVGAFMMVRRNVIEEVGLLDEDFFMYGEDVDWCYRIKQAGWKISYYPKTSIIHYKGGSNKKKNPRIVYEFYRAMYLFYNKHYKNQYSFITTLLVYTGIGTILGIKLLLNALKGLRGKSL